MNSEFISRLKTAVDVAGPYPAWEAIGFRPYKENLERSRKAIEEVKLCFRDMSEIGEVLSLAACFPDWSIVWEHMESRKISLPNWAIFVLLWLIPDADIVKLVKNGHTVDNDLERVVNAILREKRCEAAWQQAKSALIFDKMEW